MIFYFVWNIWIRIINAYIFSVFIIGIIGNICFVLLYINQKSEYEFGENEKCKTYDKNHNCVSCNPGYKLEKGECILNYSFIATYQTTSPNQSVRLIFNIYIKK